jgi:hypothetical protein
MIISRGILVGSPLLGVHGVHGVVIVCGVGSRVMLMGRCVRRMSSDGHLCQLQPGALTPSCSAYDERKRQRESKGSVKKLTHRTILTAMDPGGQPLSTTFTRRLNRVLSRP